MNVTELYGFAGVEYQLRAIVDGRYFRGRWRCGACELEVTATPRR